jgi:IPT/TIG domain
MINDKKKLTSVLLIITLFIAFQCIVDPRRDRMYISHINPYSGAEGDTVNIVGNKFSSNPFENEVTFDSLKATILEARSTRLKVIVPQGARTGMVMVKTYNDIAYRNFTVTYALNEPLTITDFEPKVIKPGDTLTVYGKSFSTRKDLPNMLTVGSTSIQIIEVSSDKLRGIISRYNNSGKIAVYWADYFFITQNELTIIQ